jgi:RecB family exonuclease
MSWSATMLKSFLNCKKQFYFKYILSLKDHNISFEPQEYELGKVLHRILDKVYSKRQYYDDITILTNDIYSTLEKELSSNVYLNLNLQIYKRYLSSFIKSEIDRFDKGATVYLTEQRFTQNYKGIDITGSIDRVDIVDGRYLILDYKTSKTIKIDSIKNYEKSSDFQLEFYLLFMKNILNLPIDVAYYSLYDGKMYQEEALSQKLELLDSIFEDIKELSQNPVLFDMTQELSHCRLCPYKKLCF